MQLDAITNPDDLRERSYEELNDLCGQIRARIIEAVSARGGHLGSNLGAVELTVALHRVFRSPHDVILWDTGHQAYVHKMLTGRVADFDSLRTSGGLSGYPSRSESPHDWIENSHASTVLSYAHGLANRVRVRRQPPARRGRRRRRRPDRRHGLRGNEQHRPQRAQRDRGAQRQRAQLRAHRLTAQREPGALPLQPQDHAPPGPPRGDSRAHPVGGRHAAARHEDVEGCPTRAVGTRPGSSRTSGSATWGLSTVTTSPVSKRR